MKTEIDQILRHLPQAALAIGPDARIVAQNAGARAIFGVEATGLRFALVLRQPELLRAVNKAWRQRVEVNARARFKVGGGQMAPHDVRVAPLSVDTSGGLLILIEDLSEREENLRMRQDFVADVSHELKTPLTAIAGFLETLSGPAREDTDMRARFLELMTGEVRRMTRLVDDLLGLSQVESRTARRPDTLIDLAPVIAEVIELHLPLARTSGVTLEHRLSGDLPRVRADASQVRQVAGNLVTNALSHSGGSRVEVALEPVTRDPVLRGPAVRLAIVDDGAGIAANDLPRLTERFYRADNHRARQGPGGTGLGLSIVKHIMSRHRGRLEITSTPGAGATFNAIFPAGQDDTNL